MLKLKLQYFGHLMRRVDSLEKTLMLGGIGDGGHACSRGRVGGAPRVVSADGSGRRAGGAASTLGPGPGLLALLTPEA